MGLHPLTGFLAVAPSTVAVGERFDLRLKCLTNPHPVPTAAYTSIPRLAGPFNLSPRGIAYLDNVATRWNGPLLFDGGSAFAGPSQVSCGQLSGSFKDDARALGLVSGFSLSKPGIYSIRITDPATGIAGESNAIEATEGAPRLRLFWGDLHSQTYFSDGLRAPEELYHFARHEGFLDIFALADHSEWISDAQWEYFKRVTQASYQPGRFVTFVGQEWSNAAVGHRNIYVKGNDAPLLRSNDASADTLEKLYAVVRKQGALVIPHHSANAEMGVQWDSLLDPEHDRLVEIYSVWGNSERPAEAGNPRSIQVLGGERKGQHVLDALARGLKLGFIGGGDIHDGRPGDELHTLQTKPTMYPLLHRQGIMGVWARELTREAIWEALRNRRVYATTNVRIILRFEVCGAAMGQTVSARGPRTIRVQASSEVPILKVEIVKMARTRSLLWANGATWIGVSKTRPPTRRAATSRESPAPTVSWPGRAPYGWKPRKDEEEGKPIHECCRVRWFLCAGTGEHPTGPHLNIQPGLVLGAGQSRRTSC